MPPVAAAVGGWAALSALLGTAGGLATTGYGLAQGRPDSPDANAMFKMEQDQQKMADTSRLRGVVGGSSMQDALTRTSGSVGPDFLANVATQDAGTPGMQGDALDMVKKILAGQGQA